MRKVMMGSILVLAGLLSAAVLLAGAMASGVTTSGNWSAIEQLKYYGLTPVVWGLMGVSLIGVFLAIWGISEKKK